MSENFWMGVSMIPLGALCITLGLRKKKNTLYGLKFRLLLVGIAAVIAGIYLLFQ
ncbi:MAG TPA: hypothetical protein VGE79_02175 [Niastella sp.]